MDGLIFIFFSAMVINNFTLSYFLGLCPFFGVSNKVGTALRMGAANIFVMLITIVCTFILRKYVLPSAEYLQLICYIFVIASSVQLTEMLIKKLFPPLFKALGIFLPLITTNCAILGLALFASSKDYNLLQGIVYAIGAGMGLTLALVLMAGIRQENELASIPKMVRGVAMNFLIAGMLSLAFMGFAGLFSE